MKRIINRLHEFWHVLSNDKASWIFFIFLTFVAALFEGIGIGLVLPILESLVSDSKDSLIQRHLPELAARLTNEEITVLGLGVLLLATVLKFAVMIFKSVFAAHLVNGIRNRWREELAADILYDHGQLNGTRKHGALMDTIIMQTSGASKFIRNLTEIATEIVFSLVMLVIIISISWQITALLLVVFAVLLAAVNEPLRRWSGTLGARNTKVSQRLGALVSEALLGARQVRIFSIEREQMQAISKVNALQLNIAKQLTLLAELPPAINQITLAGLLLGGGVYLGFYADLRFVEVLPAFAVFVIVAQRLTRHSTTLMSKYVSARTNYPAFRLVMGFLAGNRETREPHGARLFEDFSNEIKFENVSFRHRNGSEVLRGFNLDIPKGTVVALVGESGAGKSTIADLLLRLRDPDAGAIRVDGIDVREFDTQSWRRRIGYVSQTPFLFNMTITDNIRLGKHNASQKDIEAAARAAYAHDFIEALPLGYETNVGDAGARLSGGQLQRIVLAQALVRNPALFVLDEPTSALDTESSRYVYRMIHDLAAQGRTVLLITHDPEAAAEALKVFTIEPVRSSLPHDFEQDSRLLGVKT